MNEEALRHLPWQEQADAVCRGFNGHPLDWQSFNEFICRMYEAGSDRPAATELREHLGQVVPEATGYPEELAIAYEAGLDLLTVAAKRWRSQA